jgi:hypothetical protein
MIENYYLSRKGRLLNGFDRARKWFTPHLIERYGQEISITILQEARKEYEQLIPNIPFIGGSKVHMTEDLMESIQILAYLRVLKAHGKVTEECKEIIYQGMERRMAQYPRFILRLGGMRAFSKPFVKYLQRQAIESQERKFPAGFVFDIVIGDSKEFDWGLNIVECGICKFYREQNASEFLPMMCSIDYILSEKLGYGLVRTATLVEGANKCNPRLKRGRPTQWRLNIDI